MSIRIAALVAFLLVFSTAIGQASFPDVPERHWAESAVERLADLGILVGFPDGTFRGGESITRYEAALVIDRLLTAIRDDSDAADAAILDQVATLRAVVMALADEAEELQRRAGANRRAIDELWAEITALREELDLPPPAPLAPYPPAAPDAAEPAAPAERPDEVPAPPVERPEEAAPPVDEPMEDAVPDEAEVREPEAAPPVQEDDAAVDVPLRPIDPDRPAAEAPEAVDPADDFEPFAAVRQPTVVYASLAGGSSVPRSWLVRATVGVDNVVGDRFGARLSVDLGRRSPSLLGSVTLLGHATYRIVEPEPLGGYVGAGMGVDFGGDGALASVLAGVTWSALDPVLLFAETTLDVYLAPALSTGGSRFGPTLVVGARWTF